MLMQYGLINQLIGHHIKQEGFCKWLYFMNDALQAIAGMSSFIKSIAF
jgi:truncated hemoglobin YjbI